MKENEENKKLLGYQQIYETMSGFWSYKLVHLGRESNNTTMRSTTHLFSCQLSKLLTSEISRVQRKVNNNPDTTTYQLD